MPTTRRPAAAARWSGPVSLEITRSDFQAEGRELGQARPAAEVQDRDRGEMAEQGVDQRPIGGRADGDQARAELFDARRRPMAAKCSGGQRLVAHRAPTFRMIRGLGSPATISAAHRRASSGIGRWKSRLGIVRAERSGDPEDPIDRVHAQPGRVDVVGVEPAGPLAGIGHPDADRAPAAATIIADRSRPWRSIVRSNRDRRSRPRSDGHPQELVAVQPLPAAIVDDQLVEIADGPRAARRTGGSRPRKDGPTAIGRAGRRGWAWRGGCPPSSWA